MAPLDNHGRFRRFRKAALFIGALSCLISAPLSATASPGKLNIESESPEVAVPEAAPSKNKTAAPAQESPGPKVEASEDKNAPSVGGATVDVNPMPTSTVPGASAPNASASVTPEASPTTTTPVVAPAAPTDLIAPQLPLTKPQDALQTPPVRGISSPLNSSTPPAASRTPQPSSIPEKAATTQTPQAPVSLAPIVLTAPDHNAVISHDEAKTLNLYPIYLSKSLELHSFDALRKESTISQEINLHDAINYVLDQGMQIKISRESMNYQHFLTLAGYASFLPTYTTQYNVGFANVYNQYTTSVSHTFLTGVNYPVFQGGAVLYSLLSQRYREKAWREAYKSTVSDVFLDVYQKYTNLILQRVLLQTLAKAVEGDEQQLHYARSRLKNDVGTRYEIMQVEALLSADKQSFLQQEVTMRQAGLALNLALNFPLSVNLVPVEQTLTEAPLFDPNVQLKTILHDTMKFNAGLRQYENFRLAAARNVQAQSASLYPAVSLFALYEINDATVSPMANGSALGGAATSAINNFLDTSFAGRVSNNSLGQQYSFSPTAGSTSTQGANTGPSAMPASSGGTPIAQVQSGSLVSSGAVAPSIFGGGNGASSGPNTNGSLQAPAGIFPGIFRESQIGFSLSWSLPNLGVQTATSIAASKVLARQALMQCNQEISIVVQQVRGDFLSYLSARDAIDKSAVNSAATKEALGYANARLGQGVATELDLIHAQHDHIAALTAQAQAIVASNVAQAQLLHDMGMINATTLTEGYRPGTYIKSKATGAKKSY